MTTASRVMETLRRAASAAVVCMVAFCAACSSLLTPNVTTGVTELRAGEYRLDKQHATLLFKVDHLGLSEFVGRFNEFDATLDFDPERIEEARLEAVIQTASIDVNDPEFEEELRGRDWFNTTRFPEAVFRTNSVTLIDDESARFSGELTLLGVNVPVELNVVFNGGANNLLTLKYTIGFSATTSFMRSDVGMDHYIPAVGDEVNIEVYAEFQRQ
jgi:polyisoprenoid-binding protein YceI